MTATVTDTSRITQVTGVGQIVITPVTSDPVTGQALRAIRIYADPVAGSDPPAFELRISADTAAKIAIQAPNTTF